MTAGRLQDFARHFQRLGAVVALLTGLAVSAYAGDGVAGDSAAPGTLKPGSPLAAPDSPKDRTKAFDELFARLGAAASPSEADPIRAQIRQRWLDSGSPTVDLLLARDAGAALYKDSATRRRLLEAITRLAPADPEGWNRRAEFDYSEQHYGEAITDLGHVLAIEPRHFDALEGFASLMKETGHNGLALKAFRQLQTIDPTSANIQSEIDDLARKVEGQKI